LTFGVYKISIKFNNNDNVSNELKELISLQNKLKILILSAYNASWVNIIPDLTRHSNTITKLHLFFSVFTYEISKISIFFPRYFFLTDDKCKSNEH